MMRYTNANAPADLATLDDPDARLALLANLRMTLSETTDAAQAYTMEVLATETDWTDLMAAARDVPTWFINGAQDPTTDLDTIAAYGKAYPWIEIETHADAGWFLLYQKFDILIPRLAAAAHRARSDDG
jgi:pimeloyl-ACP methyl ester carboxylesterase